MRLHFTSFLSLFLSRGVSFFPRAIFSRLKIPQRCDETTSPLSEAAGVFIVCPFSSDFTQLELESRSRSILREKNLFSEYVRVRVRSTSCGVAAQLTAAGSRVSVHVRVLLSHFDTD